MNHGSRFLHHGVLLIVLHQVRERVKPLSSSHVVLPIWLQEGDRSTVRLEGAGSPTRGGQHMAHLVVDHHVGDVGFPVPCLHLILVCQHRQHKVSWFALALPHQKAARLPLLRQKFLCLLASEVPVVPPGEQC